MEYRARHYQEMAYQHLMTHAKAGLFLDVGLGKSVVSATVARDKLLTCDILQWVIIAPLKVCQTTWQSEFAKWDHLKKLRVVHLHGKTPAQREALLKTPADVFVINFENVLWLDQVTKSRWPMDGLIIDESSKVKDSSTKLFKALKKATANMDCVVELTGSPCAQSLLGLWSQVYLLDSGQRLGRTFTSFKTEFFDSDYMGYTFTPKEGTKDRIEQAIGDVCLTLRSKDFIDVSEPIVNRIDLRLSDDVLKSYRELQRDFLTDVDGNTISAVNAGVLSGKLSQLASGSYYTYDDGGAIDGYLSLHEDKLQAVADFAEEQGRPFILAYYYRADRERLRDRFKDRIEFFTGGAEQLARWNAGAIPILALHPKSAGHGVDGLQHATNTVLWIAPPWSREDFDQLNGRVTGARQVGTAFEGVAGCIHILVARDTIDEVSYSTLLLRGVTQDNFLDALRRYVNDFNRT